MPEQTNIEQQEEGFNYMDEASDTQALPQDSPDHPNFSLLKATPDIKELNLELEKLVTGINNVNAAIAISKFNTKTFATFNTQFTKCQEILKSFEKATILQAEEFEKICNNSFAHILENVGTNVSRLTKSADKWQKEFSAKNRSTKQAIFASYTVLDVLSIANSVALMLVLYKLYC